MTTSPLAALDAMIAPIIISANIARQARDALPEPVWRLVPGVLRDPIDLLFENVEKYDRMIGRMRLAGVMPEKEAEE